MYKRISLTNPAGATVYINPSYIVAVRPSGDDPKNSAKILLVTGVEWEVKETGDQVLEKIDSLDWGGPTDSPAAD
jgi:hypothetical protein